MIAPYVFHVPFIACLLLLKWLTHKRPNIRFSIFSRNRFMKIQFWSYLFGRISLPFQYVFRSSTKIAKEKYGVARPSAFANSWSHNWYTLRPLLFVSFAVLVSPFPALRSFPANSQCSQWKSVGRCEKKNSVELCLRVMVAGETALHTKRWRCLCLKLCNMYTQYAYAVRKHPTFNLHVRLWLPFVCFTSTCQPIYIRHLARCAFAHVSHFSKFDAVYTLLERIFQSLNTG